MAKSIKIAHFIKLLGRRLDINLNFQLCHKHMIRLIRIFGWKKKSDIDSSWSRVSSKNVLFRSTEILSGRKCTHMLMKSAGKAGACVVPKWSQSKKSNRYGNMRKATLFPILPELPCIYIYIYLCFVFFSIKYVECFLCP